MHKNRTAEGLKMGNFKKYLLKYRWMVIITAHIVFIGVAYIGAFYVRFEYKLPGEYFQLIVETLPFLILIKVIAFYYFGLYAGLWRYVLSLIHI